MAMAAGPEVERAEDLAALHRLAVLVARAAPLEAVFHAAGEHTAAMLGGASGAVLRFLGDERAVVLSIWRAPGSRGFPVNAELDFQGPYSALARARSTRLPARLDSFDGPGELPLYMRASGARAAVAAPVLVEGHDEVWGALAVATNREEPIPPAAEQRLVPFAELIAQAIANSEARRRLVQAADESRQRLERELHQGAQQHLLALTLKLRLARERVEEGSLLAQLLTEAIADANEATDALDDLGRSLHPAVLVERGLAPALQALAARAAIPVHLREVPARRFHATTEATIYGVVADGLRSADCEVEVSVADRGDRLHVELRGCAGTGLDDAIDRVAALGGHLEVGPAAGGEPIVRGTIPVER
jgi:signal transduction histidine kinase